MQSFQSQVRARLFEALLSQGQFVKCDRTALVHVPHVSLSSLLEATPTCVFTRKDDTRFRYAPDSDYFLVLGRLYGQSGKPILANDVG